MIESLANVPPIGDKRIAVHVNSRGEAAIRSGHPWLFESAIVRQSHDGNPGDLAVLFDRKRKFLAIGLYDPYSPIRVKILQHHTQANIDESWFYQRLKAAVELRTSLIGAGTNGYRLVHGENDGFPGLIIDRYADTLVIKLYTLAWMPHLASTLAGIASLTDASRWILRLSRNMQKHPELLYGLHDGMALKGNIPKEPIQFQENGLCFQADVLKGHKTGFFFDQRENRQRVRQLTRHKRVLDVFAYTGGFSIYAAAGGADLVHAIDISIPAMETVKAHFALNHSNEDVSNCQLTTDAGDAFALLENLRSQNAQYDVVIVDPPSFAKRQSEIDRAVQAYRRLAKLAVSIVSEKGILVFASCSSRVPADLFFSTILHGAQDAGYSLVELERTFHALDHPINFPEGAYLKCLYAQVDK